MTTEPYKEPLIGRRVRITKSPNPSLIGKEGFIADETKHTLTIGNKTIIKDSVTIDVDGSEIDGKNLTKTPSERIKVHKQ